MKPVVKKGLRPGEKNCCGEGAAVVGNLEPERAAAVKKACIME